MSAPSASALALFAAAGLTAAEPQSVLFIGNSLTFTNDLPQVLAALAQAGGRPPLELGRELVGGRTLAQHWSEGRALAALRARPWTWVVLQDQSTRTLDQPAEFADYGRRFIAAALERGARPVLYATWARLGEMPTQERITAAYRGLAQESGALLVTAGDAFARYRQAHGDGVLFTDNRHPTPAGTYLAACCFYATLYQADPAGLPAIPAILSGGQAEELQRLAWPPR